MSTPVVDHRAPAGTGAHAGAAPLAARVLRQAGYETGTALRNGEQLLVTVVLPLPAPLRAAGLDESARLRVAGVRGPDDLAVLAASWREHALMPTRFERAGLRLEQILRETAA